MNALVSTDIQLASSWMFDKLNQNEAYGRLKPALTILSFVTMKIEPNRSTYRSLDSAGKVLTSVSISGRFEVIGKLENFQYMNETKLQDFSMFPFHGE